jgi:hypothetical protein
MDYAREQYEIEVGEAYLEEFGHERLYPEHYEEAVKEFTAERLRSYYVAHPDLAKPAQGALEYAKSLLPAYPRAALVFAASASEVVWKTCLLKPIVFGLVRTEGLASFITDLTTRQTGMERFQDILTQILDQYGGVDLKTYKRTGVVRTLWEEMLDVQTARSRILHNGETSCEVKADLAVSVANTLLLEVYPQVLKRLGVP